MKILGQKALVRGIAWLRGRLSGGGLILLYHRVFEGAGDPRHDPFDLGVTPEHFAEHLEVLRHTTRVLPLMELGRRLASGERLERTVAITFDDGYHDNLEVALPLLEQFAVPATFFVVSGALGRPFWWDELAYRVLTSELPSSFQLPIGERSIRFAGTDRPRLLRSLHGVLRPLAVPTRATAFKALRECLRDDVDADGARALSTEELRSLAASTQVEIGAHTVSHPPLTALDQETRRREIADSRSGLEEIIGRAVTSFSYPYGTTADFDRPTVEMARAAGFERAVTNLPGLATSLGDPLRWPRLWVSDAPGKIFARRLDRWLTVG